MKKCLFVLLAAMTAACSAGAACSKGQTGGGNGMLGRYGQEYRERGEENAPASPEGRRGMHSACPRDEHGGRGGFGFFPPHGHGRRPMPVPPPKDEEDNEGVPAPGFRRRHA